MLGSFTYYFQTSNYAIITQIIAGKFVIRDISNKSLYTLNIINYIS